MNKNGESKDQNRLYKDLSWTWPIISPPEDYISEGNLIIEKIREFQKSDCKSLLNLGCGGGHVDWVLKREFDITGVDLSENMLALAKKLNPEAEYLQGDMRTVRLKRLFDVVLIHDAINYMITEDDLKAAFKTGYDHLKKNGLMVTFVEEWPEHFVQNRVNHFTKSKDDIEITFIDNAYDPDPSDTSYEYSIIYLIRREKKLDIQFDRHMSGIFPLSYWENTLMSVGFEILNSKSTPISHENNENLPMFVGLKI